VTDRVEALRTDIDRAPQALTDLLEAYDAPDGPMRSLDPGWLRGRRVAFVGLGSSLFASMDAASALRANGVPALADFASTDGTPPSKDLVLVAVSASGRTREVVDVARRHRGTSLVIAVTNMPASPLAGAADVVLPLFAGVEASGISTLTYRATVVVLGLLAGRFGIPMADHGDLWDTVARLDVDSEGENLWMKRAVDAAADLLDGAPSIDVIGPAARLGAVSQAALLLREGPRLPAHPWETADWLHTAVYLALPGHRAVVFAGSPADGEVIDTILRRGGKVVIAGEASAEAPVALDLPAGDPRLHMITQSLALDRLALELWRRASAEG